MTPEMPASRARLTPDDRSAGARVAPGKRHHRNDEKTKQMAADLAAERLAEHIQRVVDQARPLSLEQRDRLALLLRGAGASR